MVNEPMIRNEHCWGVPRPAASPVSSSVTGSRRRVRWTSEPYGKDRQVLLVN